MLTRVLSTCAVLLLMAGCAPQHPDKRPVQRSAAPAPASGASTPESSEPAASTPSSPASQGRVPGPELTPVTIDGWRYGYAWTGFTKDIGNDETGYDKPGETHISLTVQMTVTDSRRPLIPSPNSLWVGRHYGFDFFVKKAKDPSCPDMVTDNPGLCEQSSGSFYTNCTSSEDASTQGGFRPGGQVIETCRLDNVFPESVNVKDFRVAIRYTKCCGEDTSNHYVWLPYQGLHTPSPAL